MIYITSLLTFLHLKIILIWTKALYGKRDFFPLKRIVLKQDKKIQPNESKMNVTYNRVKHFAKMNLSLLIDLCLV